LRTDWVVPWSQLEANPKVEVTAAFAFTDDTAVEHLREGLPATAEVISDGATVRVRAFYDDAREGPGDLPDGAFVAMRQSWMSLRPRG
jgi:hypothetical protein